jgi:DNA helicase-2/ATP-dependent DNA helicase PcrA
VEVQYPLDKKEVADALQYLATIDVKEIKLHSELNLQGIYHEFLRRISIVEDGKPETEILMYNLGKFSQVIADFEGVNYTLKPRTKLNSFCSFLKYTASQYYPEGYLTNSYAKPDAVSIMTVHQSKGLEFAAVFIPQLNRNFFPAQRVGGKGIWHVIDKEWITDADRFNGDIEEERKLFYVAVTRAKKYLYLTRSQNSRDKHISPFLEEARESSYMVKFDENMQYDPEHLPVLKRERMPLTLNFSLLEDYFDCPYRFKLTMFYGFVQPIVPAL